MLNYLDCADMPRFENYCMRIALRLGYQSGELPDYMLGIAHMSYIRQVHWNNAADDVAHVFKILNEFKEYKNNA